MLVDPDMSWRHRDSGSDATMPHWQWNSPGDGTATVAFMINADVALYKDIQVEAEG